MRERDCIFEMIQKKAPVHVQLKGKPVPGFISQKTETVNCKGISTWLEPCWAAIKEQSCLHREAEFQPLSKAPSLDQ